METHYKHYEIEEWSNRWVGWEFCARRKTKAAAKKCKAAYEKSTLKDAKVSNRPNPYKHRIVKVDRIVKLTREVVG